MTRPIPRQTLIAIRETLEDCAKWKNVSPRVAEYLVGAINVALKPRRGVAKARARRELKRERRAQDVRDLRTQVMTRAQGLCESCFVNENRMLEMDHFRGGKDRRSFETPEWCWALCHECHEAKTRLMPNAEHWFVRFKEHCAQHGYWEQMRWALARKIYVAAKKHLSQRA